jgi:pimeloyl-ACP methyl ester carboxylesterase
MPHDRRRHRLQGLGTRPAHRLQPPLTAHRGCLGALTPDLHKLDVPTLVIHGDDDQFVPFAASAPLTAKIVNEPS